MYHDLGTTYENIKDMAYSKNPSLPKVRQEAVRLVYKGWPVHKVARHFGYTHSAIVKWCKKDPSGRYQIATKSSRPHTSPNALSKEVVSAIITKRLGRRRCGQVIHQQLLQDGVVVSLPSVQRTLGRLHLLKKRSPWKRPHDYTERPQATHPGALLQCDTVHIMLPDGSRLYVYTVIDLYSRWAYAAAVSRISAKGSSAFIRRAQRAAPFRFEMVQTDHGPEFSTGFTHALWTASLSHRHARVRHSNDNAHIERFNRSVQEECLDHTPHTITAFKEALKKYLFYYNTERMHMGINFKTPAQMLKAVPSS